MIATTRYGIYDLSYWRENDQSAWTMPRNVLIELGMAIALNRPMLLLRHGKNRECGLTLPACLQGIDIGEFGDGKKLLRETLKARLPSLTQHTPKQDWLNRYCHFGALECPYREVHPQAQQWGRQKIHIHISDGANAAHIECSEFHEMIEEEVIDRFSNLEFNYLDSLTCPQGHKFLLCSRCQQVRTSPFAIYRITPHTSADTFIAIGMSIALEKQFNYPITKILVTDDKNNIPSLLEGYEMIVERNYTRIKDRLNLILPEMIEKTRQTTWKPKPLPFEVFLPTKEQTEPEETASADAYSENDTQAQGDKESSLQQETEGNRDIDQMDGNQTRDRYDKFTERSRKVLLYAQEEALHLRHNYIGTEHLLLGLVREGDGVAAKLLANLGVDLNKGRSAVEVIVGRGDHIVFTKRTPLAHAREEKGWSQAYVAEQVGVTVDAVRRWEAGSHLPYQKTIHKLCTLFGMTPKTLGLLKQQNTPQSLSEIGLNSPARKVIELAVDEARRLNHHYIGTEHLLLGLVREGEGIAAGVLESLGVTLKDAHAQIIQVISLVSAPTTADIDRDIDQKGNERTRDRDRFDKFSERARKVLSLALEEAQSFQHNSIGTEHILLGLIREREGIAAKVLTKLGADLNKVRSAVEFIEGRGDRVVDEISLKPRAKKVIELAVDEAHHLNHSSIGTEHLLLALLHEGEGIGAGILESLGIDLERAHTQTIQALSQASAHKRQ